MLKSQNFFKIFDFFLKVINTNNFHLRIPKFVHSCIVTFWNLKNQKSAKKNRTILFQIKPKQPKTKIPPPRPFSSFLIILYLHQMFYIKWDPLNIFLTLQIPLMKLMDFHRYWNCGLFVAYARTSLFSSLVTATREFLHLNHKKLFFFFSI